MSVFKDAIAAMQKVVLLNDKEDRAGQVLADLSKEIRDHDRRLVRLETLVEVARSQRTLDNKSG